MSQYRAAVRPLRRRLQSPSFATTTIRPLTNSPSSSAQVADAAITASEPTNPLDQNPDTVSPAWEAHLIKQGRMPVGSRRRRLALRDNRPHELPFEQLPYQAFQEARKILAADREEKLAAIQKELQKIEYVRKRDAATFSGGQKMKEDRLEGLQKQLERLKILADVNDPAVKKRFEDGLGDMNKPIYRYYAERKWRSYDYRLITQRISQFHIVPDILPKFDPTADVQLFFRRAKIPPGQVVDSLVSERPPHLRVQVFDKGERLVTVVVMDSDVPDLASDTFTKRCHFMAVNVPLSPTETSLAFHFIPAHNRIVPWLPPTSPKGSPYHRLSVFLLEQPTGEKLDAAKLRTLYSPPPPPAASTPTTPSASTPSIETAVSSSSGSGSTTSSNFSLKSLRDKFNLTPFGFTMFRSLWDENTADVMARHGIPGADVEFHPKRVYSMKQERKPKGWEAKRQSGKYRHLWKYTKRIRGVSNSRGWLKRR